MPRKQSQKRKDRKVSARTKCGMLIASVAFMLPLAARSDAPDPAAADFWYADGRASYPGATAAAVVSAAVAVVPQVSGEPTFDSGAGDVFGFVMDVGFSSCPLGVIIVVR